MIKYIDCDGVILDTETGLFDEYKRLKEQDPSLRKTIYLQEMDWEAWLEQAAVLSDAIELLNSYDPTDTAILTRIHSLKEGIAKIQYFRKNKVNNNIILVPSVLEKPDVVVAEGNILVEDSVKNLQVWESSGGIPIYFSLQEQEQPFYTISSLESVLSGKIMEEPRMQLLFKKNS